MLGNIFGRFLGNKNTAGDPAEMQNMMNRPEVRKVAAELQSRLSPEDQKELMGLILKGDQAAVKRFFEEKVPDLEEIIRGSGLA